MDTERPEFEDEDEDLESQLLDADDADLDGATDEDEPLDFSQIDPEEWQPDIPWLPPFGLVLALIAFPILSHILSGLLADRLTSEAPTQLWIPDGMRLVANVALVIGATMVLVVPIAARAVRRRPTATLRLLERGIPTGVVVIAILIVLNALLAGAAIAAIGRLVVGSFLPGVAGIVLFAGVAAAVYVVSTGWSKLRPIDDAEPALQVDRATAPTLFERLASLTSRLGVLPPDVVLVGPEMTIWSSRGSTRTLVGQVSGTTVHISLPILATLTPTQVEALLAHELAHIANGDIEVATRIGPAFERMLQSRETLETESRGAGRLAAAPAIRWVEFALDSIGVVVAEQRRASERDADEKAAGLVPADDIASALIARFTVGSFEEQWVAEVQNALESREDPVEAFSNGVLEATQDFDTADVLEASLDYSSVDQPALLNRLQAIDRLETPLAIATMESSALRAWFDDPADFTDRLLNGLRSQDDRTIELRLNEPRITPGILGWVLTGIVFAAIFGYRGLVADDLAGEWLQILVVIAALWIIFPLVYPYLQREVELDRRGVRIRPWWYRWVDPDASRLPWTELRWTDTMDIEVRFESIVSVSNGAEQATWWAGIWPKQELEKLTDALAARGAVVGVTSSVGVSVDERHAVVWYVCDRFLVPRLRTGMSGELLEVRDVATMGTGALRLSFALVDRLDEPVKVARANDRIVSMEHLAGLAKVDPQTFEATAKRVTIDSERDVWRIAVTGSDDVWTPPRSMDEADMAELILEILGLPFSATGRRKKRTQPPPEHEEGG